MKKIFALIAFFALSSCVRLGEYNSLGFRDLIIDGAGTLTFSKLDTSYTLVRTEEITEENFEENKNVVAHTGGIIYSVKKYVVSYYEKKVLITPDDITLKGMASNVEIKANVQYERIGTVKIDGKKYYLINPQSTDIVLVDKKGKVYPYIGRKIADNRIMMLTTKFVVDPENAKLRTATNRKTATLEPHEGIEVIFDGKKGDFYYIRFKDFDGTGTEEYKSVEFSEDYDFVDFGNLKVEVISVTPNRFEGKVIK